MLYLLYYRVQLRLKIGRLADALQILLPFARQKQRDFWVWDLMADLHPTQPDLQLACYAKALSCKVRPEFLVKLRQKLARLLVQQGRWAEAKAEIEEVLRVRTAHQWRIPMEISEWMRTPGYTRITADIPNVNYYTQMGAPAGRLLLDPQAGVLGVVTGSNEQKRTAQFVVSEEVSGGFGYAALGFEPAVGDCLLLHLEPRTAPDGTTFQKVLHARLTAPVDTPLLRTVSGTFKRVGTAGFVGNAFVEGALAAQLEEGQPCRVQAVKSFNARRQNWGWKAFRILN